MRSQAGKDACAPRSHPIQAASLASGPTLLRLLHWPQPMECGDLWYRWRISTASGSERASRHEPSSGATLATARGTDSAPWLNSPAVSRVAALHRLRPSWTCRWKLL